MVRLLFRTISVVKIQKVLKCLCTRFFSCLNCIRVGTFPYGQKAENLFPIWAKKSTIVSSRTAIRGLRPLSFCIFLPARKPSGLKWIPPRSHPAATDPRDWMSSNQEMRAGNAARLTYSSYSCITNRGYKVRYDKDLSKIQPNVPYNEVQWSRPGL